MRTLAENNMPYETARKPNKINTIKAAGNRNSTIRI